ncbi:extracellular solute-binding protein [Cucumibacter marinus]|uniref:extracellular solute-binding protein n=1 Tax=Cucumibacter marinus TaxID=1121252 RepID=UPI000411518A|nr:extracellular solute-binding protein [Cucumibacter marinus]
MYLKWLGGGAVAALMALTLVPAALAQDAGDDRVWHKSTSLVGEAKYPEGFAHFDYVNPDAPKGGNVRLSSLGSFDSFNTVPAKGETAPGLGLIYDTLLTPSMDEVSTYYVALAEAFTYPEDFSSVTYRLRPDATWHDGVPITVDDIVWSFNKATELNPNLAAYYENVSAVEITGDRDVTFSFDSTGNRELPQIMGQMPILPKHWWEANGPDGEPRDLGASTLEPPLGSGPYRIKDFVAGRTITYERVEDYWGEDLPVNIGHNNFDTITYEEFRDGTVMFEAFKGDEFDWWSENRAQRWAQAYDFPAVNQGRIVRERFENPMRDEGVMVGFILNTKRPPFDDVKVREALNYAFDFETLQRDLFFGEYERVDSFFFPTELASSGLPEGEELEILESVRDLIPEKVFTTPFENPVNGSPTNLRANLRIALDLLAEAGYTLDGNRLVDENGEQLSFEVILSGPTIEPVALSWLDNLERIGIAGSVRSLDSSQYVNRLISKDYDVVYYGLRQSLSPGNEQRRFWGSQSADVDGTFNLAKLTDPGVDALIDKVIFADDRETLVAATRALDRVLLAHHIVVPSYAASDERIARWDRFSHPDTLPEFSIGFPSVWWYDEEKAAKVDK